MRSLAIILVAVFCGQVVADDARLSPRFRTVYILSMPNAMDQYIASRVTSSRVLWVVLDPAGADAVLTDNLDEGFWTWLTRVYPSSASAPGNANRGSAYRGAGAPANIHRGTIFLVDPRRRVVLWSTYEHPRNSSPAELDHVAARITGQLKNAFGKK